MSTPSIQIARGRPLNFFFSDRNTQIQTHQLRRTALECHSTPLPGSANNFLSTAFACCARGISWSGKIASRAAIGGSNYCDKSAVWSQHHPERTPRFSAEKLNMLVGYRISHTSSDRSNWCCERVCVVPKGVIFQHRALCGRRVIRHWLLALKRERAASAPLWIRHRNHALEAILPLGHLSCRSLPPAIVCLITVKGL